RRWTTIVAVTPNIAGLESRIWPLDLLRFPQGSGNIGTRMARIFDAMPKGPVVIIGADIPGIEKRHIAGAFRKLGSCDVVFGPAVDGGFWLVGLKRMRPRPRSMFRNTRWSTKFALSDSISSIPDSKISLIDTLSDVDTIDDLRTTFPRDADV
ncbi:MAG: TIGR04282 family arsenosugar biosynthesis glycosyltransferase, partial [Paracoccaceae bacterium]